MKENKIYNNFQNLIKRFVKIGERQFLGAKKAANIIKTELDKYSVKYTSCFFDVEIPKGKSVLKVNNKLIQSFPTSFVSGTFTSDFSVTNSLITPQSSVNGPKINFNPKCKTISRPNTYFAPSMSISAKDANRIKNSSTVTGVVDVTKMKVKNEQILFGNTKNPISIFFCHYDSIGKGAIDNASGVAVLLCMIFSNIDSLKNNLFVFDGNEELSYDYPKYWGRGYREFFSNKLSVFVKNKIKKVIKNIYVVDSIGYSCLKIYSNDVISDLAFPVPKKMIGKAVVSILSGEYNKLMKVYHSDLDDGRMIKEKYVLSVLKKIRTLV